MTESPDEIADAERWIAGMGESGLKARMRRLRAEEALRPPSIKERVGEIREQLGKTEARSLSQTTMIEAPIEVIVSRTFRLGSGKRKKRVEYQLLDGDEVVGTFTTWWASTSNTTETVYRRIGTLALPGGYSWDVTTHGPAAGSVKDGYRTIATSTLYKGGRVTVRTVAADADSEVSLKGSRRKRTGGQLEIRRTRQGYRITPARSVPLETVVLHLHSMMRNYARAVKPTGSSGITGYDTYNG